MKLYEATYKTSTLRLTLAKDAINRDRHGLSLADAAGFDLSNALVEMDSCDAYGELRYRACGRIKGRGTLTGGHLFSPCGAGDPLSLCA